MLCIFCNFGCLLSRYIYCTSVCSEGATGWLLLRFPPFCSVFKRFLDGFLSLESLWKEDLILFTDFKDPCDNMICDTRPEVLKVEGGPTDSLRGIGTWK